MIHHYSVSSLLLWSQIQEILEESFLTVNRSCTWSQKSNNFFWLRRGSCWNLGLGPLVDNPSALPTELLLTSKRLSKERRGHLAAQTGLFQLEWRRSVDYDQAWASPIYWGQWRMEWIQWKLLFIRSKTTREIEFKRGAIVSMSWLWDKLTMVRFSNKKAKLLKSQKFAPELDHLVCALNF